MGSKVADRVVAPVIPQPAIEQHAVLHEVMNRHELNCGHAELLQMANCMRMRQTRIGPANLRRQRLALLREAFDVQLVNDRFVQGNSGRRVAAPIEGRIDDDTARHEWSAVALIGHVGRRSVGPDHMPEDGGLVFDVTLNGERIRIQEQLRVVAAQAFVGAPGPFTRKP